MKLSDAIRLGSMLNPQGFDDYRDQDGRTCALGAAQDALGRSDDTFMETAEWPWLETRTQCPSCRLRAVAGEIVTHLNDSHRWTREQIADWVATVEPALSTTVEDRAGEVSRGRATVEPTPVVYART